MDIFDGLTKYGRMQLAVITAVAVLIASIIMHCLDRLNPEFAIAMFICCPLTMYAFTE